MPGKQRAGSNSVGGFRTCNKYGLIIFVVECVLRYLVMLLCVFEGIKAPSNNGFTVSKNQR